MQLLVQNNFSYTLAQGHFTGLLGFAINRNFSLSRILLMCLFYIYIYIYIYNVNNVFTEK